MIPKIKNILYATDLSQNSPFVFQYAVDLAEKYDAHIYLLHVMERTPSQEHLVKGSPMAEALKDEYEKERVGEVGKIKHRMEAFCTRELKERSLLLKRVSIHVIDGHPPSGILEKVDELRPDVLVMGTHSKDFLTHAFLGSVAQKVLDRVKIPVLIIPIPEKTDSGFRDVRESIDTYHMRILKGKGKIARYLNLRKGEVRR
jgi:nucleotide-binding universal stress UspA family protein